MENDGLSKINHLLAPDQLQHTHIQDIQFKRIDKKNTIICCNYFICCNHIFAYIKNVLFNILLKRCLLQKYNT